MWKCASLKSIEVTHSSACREVLIVSGVSILNNSVFRKVFKVLKSKIGLRQLLDLGTTNSLLQNLEISELLPVPLHFRSEADAMPPTRGSCGDSHSTLQGVFNKFHYFFHDFSTTSP